MVADSLSRVKVDQREWSLQSKIAQHLFLRWGLPQVDLFAFSDNYSDFLFPVPLPDGISSGRFFTELGDFYASLRLSSHGVAREGASEGHAGPGNTDPNCSSLANEVVVSSPARVASRSTSPVAQGSGLAQPVQPLSPGPCQSKPSGVEGQRVCLRAEGFSQDAIQTILHARASGTTAGYESKWGVYVRWCRQRGVDPHSTTVVIICDFLQFKLEEGLQWQMLKGYVAAINAFHTGLTADSLGRDKRIVQFMKGTFRLRPPVKPVIPVWDLHVVLQAICGAPFEPMDTALLKYVTWKTVFLLAITSAARVSELQALDSCPELSRVSRNAAVLRLNPAFIPKVANVEYLNREIELEAFFPHPTNLEQRAMHKHCPVRALSYYMARTKDLHKDSQLLVSYRAGQIGTKVTKTTVSRWIRDTIIMAYNLMGRPVPTTMVKAHSTRAVATSLADLRGVSPTDLCRAATWSSSSVHRDIKPDNILLDEEGHVHITDFNIATQLQESQLATSMSGTKPYMAPEVFACALEEIPGYGFPVDWWSLGVCAYEMLRGKRPYEIHSATSVNEVWQMFVTNSISYPSVMDEGMRDLLRKLLAVDPSKRLCQLAELKQHLYMSDMDFDRVYKLDNKPSFVPPKDHLNCDPTFELEEMIIEAKPLHKKKKRLAKQNSKRDHSNPQSQELDPMQACLENIDKEFRAYNREKDFDEKERQKKLEEEQGKENISTEKKSEQPQKTVPSSENSEGDKVDISMSQTNSNNTSPPNSVDKK